ncbi:MAG: ABC transporter ATP-binding protein [Rhodospirillales bacterium]|nr:ABC transporter ATP-binding protein [Rhodospirillales bacterium]
MSLVLEQLGMTVRGEEVIRDVSLRLERGTMTILLGPTLSGKTSLMRLMAGLDQPGSGRILMDGHDVTGVPVRRRSVAMVYQQFVNYPSHTVYENIASPLRVAGLKKAEIDARVQQAARLLRLESLLTRTPTQLSGGQQQRTALARALVKGADLVLLDEPLANLDYKLREELREELPRLFAQSGAILVYATTEPAEALLLGGFTATLSEGRVTQFGPTAEVFRHPGTLAAARVFSDPPLNELPVEKRGPTVTLANGRTLPAVGALANLPDGAYRIAVRAEDVTIGEGQAGAFVFSGQVAVSEISGSESFVHIGTDLTTFVCVEPGVHEREPGAAIAFSIDPQRLFVFDASGTRAAAPTMAEPA